MFNVGWPELFIIVAIAVLVIGPQDMQKQCQEKQYGKHKAS